jgi:hypothetical protein
MWNAKLLAVSLVITGAVACKSDPAMAPTSTTPGGTAAERPAPPPGDADAIGAPKYAVCGGQGGNPRQRAPGFLDKMEMCRPADAAPVDTLSQLAGDGALIPGKGDCQFDRGISCHFHTSMEFVATGKLQDNVNRVGEMHCIVPSAYSSSPTVYGAHVRCKAGTTPASGMKACSKELLQTLDTLRCHDGWKCCDNGTLTKPVDKQSPAELTLRPDFRICADNAIEVDCGLFHGMHGHTANVVGLGQEINGTFNADDAHAQNH